MGYRDSDDSGFSRHGMSRDHNDHPDLDRDEDLRTRHSVPIDSRAARNDYPGGRRDGRPGQGYPGQRGWEGRDFARDRYQGQGQGSGYRNPYDAGYGYGARAPDIGGYDPYNAPDPQRYRQQPYRGGYGPDEHSSRLSGPETWSREGHGTYADHGRDDRGAGPDHGARHGRSYGYGYDGQPDGGHPAHDRQGSSAGYGTGSHDGYPQYPHQYPQQHRDPEYAAWRQEQLRLLDEDYDSWRKERYQKFSEEFNTWRSMRSRNEGLRGSNQSEQVTPASGKSPQGTGSSSNNGSGPGKSKD